MSASSRPRAAVIGGGIGGLCAAIALRRRGWDVEVFEETESVVVGAGITLWSNGLAALGVLGVADEVRTAGTDMTGVRIVDSTGRELMRQQSRPGSLVALHRRDLNGALLSALPGDVVRTSTPATVVDAGRGVVEADGREAHYDLVVAADGVHSRTRLRWWPEADGERDCGIRAWRAVVDGAADEAMTVWGPAGECGILPLPDDTTYVFAASRGPARAGGLSYFDDWVDPVPTLLHRIAEPIVHDLTDLDPVRQPVKGATVLIGDAAHAMRPHLGQGAGLSIEDAVVLAEHCDPSGAFDGAGFARARRRRWSTVAFLARRATSVMMPTNPVTGLAHTLVPLVPDRLMGASVERIADWRP
ncbi:FAD-dependent monooxygenase [Gordonia sp. (in: high G+C Gram-positive bacteria)]|uniref:FAD-dependent monooxygenase n=1 Tax=Gordonia sp. (in: high G+C Gram-positive bacteria) TaxID=84139 RepID=UPI0039E68C1B